MEPLRKHWSYSSINQFLRCPRQFYFQRVAGIPQTTVGCGLVLGSAVHAALAEYHQRIMWHEDEPSCSLQDRLIQSWKNKESQSEVIYKSGESRANQIELAVALLELYLKEPPPENIIAVEKAMMAPLQNSHGEYLETPLLAYADLLTHDDGEIKIREFKTSSRTYSSLEAETSLQPTCYVIAAESTFDLLATVEYTVLVKTKTPKIQTLTTARHEEDFGRLGDTVEAIERAIDAEAFYPIENPMNCATCSYRKECRDWMPLRLNEDENLVALKHGGSC